MGLSDHAADWDAVGAQADGHYATTLAWLGAWAAAASPPELLHVRIAEPGGSPVALGVLVRGGRGRLRFAGGPETPHARLLAVAGREREAWAALARWLRSCGPLLSVLQATGVPAQARSLPGATGSTIPEYRLDLPDSFDAYIAARSRAARKALRQKLRRIERDGARVAAIDPSGHAGALRRFVVLHGARAAQRGEEHPAVGERLCRLLLALPPDGPVRLRVFALARDGAPPLAISVRLDHDDTAYFYNAGFEPSAAALSPGVSVELGSISDAIARGLERYDLGPGSYRYKTDLGGVRRDRYSLVLPGRLVHGRALALAQRVRRSPLLHRRLRPVTPP